LLLRVSAVWRACRLARPGSVPCSPDGPVEDPMGGATLTAAGVAELVRRARLKIGWPSGRAGSSPAPGIAQPSKVLASSPVLVPPFVALGQRMGQHTLMESLSTAGAGSDREFESRMRPQGCRSRPIRAIVTAPVAHGTFCRMT